MSIEFIYHVYRNLKLLLNSQIIELSISMKIIYDSLVKSKYQRPQSKNWKDRLKSVHLFLSKIEVIL